MVLHCRFLFYFLRFTDDVYTPEDIARQIDMDVGKPLEYSDIWEKPVSGKVNKRRQYMQILTVLKKKATTFATQKAPPLRRENNS